MRQCSPDLNNHTQTITIESWFIPIDILMVICAALASVMAFTLICIMILDRTCRTVPMMFIINSYLAEFFFATVVMSMALFTLHNDLRQLEDPDPLCIVRGFLSYVVVTVQNYSYLLQTIYRYISVVYPNRLSWQSMQYQIFLVVISWVFAFVCPLPYIVNHEITYDVENQTCQMPMKLCLITVYNVLCVFIVPLSLILLLYYKLVRFMRSARQNVNLANKFKRIQREVKMIRRIIILFMGIFALGFPYALLLFISFLTTPPKYHFRIAYIFITTSVVFVVIALFQFTEPLKAAVKRLTKRQVATLPVIS